MSVDADDCERPDGQWSIDRLLTCTRAARRSLDLSRPVGRAVIEECLEIAVHAPSASNRQGWTWVVVSESSLRSEIARLYQAAFARYGTIAAGEAAFGWGDTGDVSARQRNLASAKHLADHIADVPALVIPCHRGRPPQLAGVGRYDPEADRRRWRLIEAAAGAAGGRAPTEPATTPAPGSLDLARQVTYFGSIFPAVWSFQLALRSRGLGSVLTTMHLPFERQVGKLLGIPRSVTQVCLLPVAYLKHDVGPGPRRPARDSIRWERWST